MNNACSLLRLWISFAVLMSRESLSVIIKYTHRVMNGYYCDNEYIKNHTAIGHQRCVAHCITSPFCWVLSYSEKGRYCLLGAEPCVASVANDDFRLMTFRKQEYFPFTSSCIHWQYCLGTCQPARVIAKQSLPHRKAMARMAYDSDTFIGGCNPTTGSIIVSTIWYRFHTYHCHLLDVAESCSVAWVAYKAGDPLPKGAVVGGFMSAYGVTYCMRAFEGLHQYYGYYIPSAEIGHYLNTIGRKTTVQMEILVQV